MRTTTLALLLWPLLVPAAPAAEPNVRRGTTYTVLFNEAPGVSPGTPVRRSGVRIGAVREVALDNETGVVRVVLAIDAGNTIRKNEVPTLVTSPVGTDVAIDCLPKAPPPGKEVDRSPCPPGSVIRGERAAK
jgi:phospholipid/cholesterol/gamma-HCH transport system substrate-binding protein